MSGNRRVLRSRVALSWIIYAFAAITVIGLLLTYLIARRFLPLVAYTRFESHLIAQIRSIPVLLILVGLCVASLGFADVFSWVPFAIAGIYCAYVLYRSVKGLFAVIANKAYPRLRFVVLNRSYSEGWDSEYARTRYTSSTSV